MATNFLNASIASLAAAMQDANGAQRKTPGVSPLRQPPTPQPANPFDQFDAAAPSPAPGPRAIPRVIQGPPREPAPQTQDEAAKSHYEAEISRMKMEQAQRDANEGQPVPIPGNTAVNGDEYLKSIDPQVATQIRALADGRLAIPSGQALRTPYWQRLLQMTGQYDPSFDQANAATRRKTRLEFTSGVAARNITSFNTALGHLETLAKSADDLKNWDWTFGNTVGNYINNALGDPRVPKFNTAKQAVISELERAFRGSAGTLTGIKDWEASINSSQSPAQLHAVIGQMVDLLGSRIQALGEQYDAGMGKSSDPINLLDQHAQQVMRKYGTGWDRGQSQVGGGVAAPGASPNGGGGGSGIPPAAVGGVDRSTQLAMPEGPGALQASTTVKTVENPWVREHGAQLGRMIAGGVPDAQIIGFIRNTGGDPSQFMNVIAPFRRTPEFREWKRQNPNSLYPITSTMEVPLNQQEQGRAEEAASPLGAFAAGAADVPLAALEGGAALLGAGGAADELQRRRDLMAAENPAATIGGQIAGALLLPSGRTLKTILPAAAAYGAVHGFGSTAGDVGARFENALAEGGSSLALAGGLGAASKGVKMIPRRGVPGGDDAIALAQAAQAEDVPISRPIVDPTTRTRMAYLESVPSAGQRVRDSLAATEEGIERGADQLQRGGVPQERGLMGERIQGAVRQDLANQRAAASRVYDRADDMAKDMAFYGTEAVKEIDREIARLGRNPNANGGLIDYLQSVRGDFVNDAGQLLPKRIGDIRDIRTSLAQQIDARGLTKSPAERIVSRVLDRARRDIDRDFNDFRDGAQARDLYREADVRWRLAKRDEKQVAEKLLGPADNPITGKQAIDRTLQWLNSGAEGRTHATRFWEKLSPEDRRDFAATIASTYGRRAADEPFSPALFVSNTRAIPPSSRALIFGEDGAASIANLRALSKAYTDTSAALNRSRSGVVANWARFLTGFTRGGTVGAVAGSIAGGVPGGAIGGAVMSGAELLAHNLSARALMNPDMTRWLANAPRQTSDGAIRRYLDKLPGIAAREPGISSEVLGLRDGLLRLMGGGSRASEENTDEAAGGKQ